MTDKDINVTVNGTGFAGDYHARTYGMIPHKNGVSISLVGVCSGRMERARQFADLHGFNGAYTNHAAMVSELKPHIDNIACANNVHGSYVIESAEAGVSVIVLEKPPVLWPGYPEGRTASAEVRKRESMEYLANVLDIVRARGSKLLYAENFVYVDGSRAFVQMLTRAMEAGKGRILYQTGTCGHQGSHAPVYDTPSMSGGGALFNKGCHPLGSVLFFKQVEGILRDGRPIRPEKVSALALQILKHQSSASGEHFRVMQNVDDFGRITVVFDDHTVAEVVGTDLSISGIRNEVSLIADFAQYDIRINPNSSTEAFLPSEGPAGDLLFREKLPTPKGTSFPAPVQFRVHGYVGEMEDAVDCVLEQDRYPQSGAMMAWDSMAVLMAAYESSEKESAFVDVSEYVTGREFAPSEMPDPGRFGDVLQTH